MKNRQLMIVINCRKLDNQTKAIFKVFPMLYEYDATAEKCPLPLVKMRVILNKMQTGDEFYLHITDKGSKTDIPKLLTKQGYLFEERYLADAILQLHITK
jgi:TusA-related sulfurtransferase